MDQFHAAGIMAWVAAVLPDHRFMSLRLDRRTRLLYGILKQGDLELRKIPPDDEEVLD
jgi:hypothetical protein